MKFKSLLVFVVGLLFMFNQAEAQWTNKTMTHDGLERAYKVYIPANYDENEPAALVLTLHGMGDNKDNFSLIGFAPIADTANFVIVVPQAMSDPMMGTAWNSGAGLMGIFPNAAVDDVGFLNALVDTVSINYSINEDKVYVCGYSMGGFMTQRMACESNAKFAAFASVAGTRGSGITSCNPGKAIPVAHFHGTTDATVGYIENMFGMGVDPLIDFWITNNQTETTAIHTEIPVIATDGYTIDHYLYSNGNADVELFKVNGADHVWLSKPNNDISYTEEIWKFFSKQEGAVSIKEGTVKAELNVYPNPATNVLNIEINNVEFSSSYFISIYDVKGSLVYQEVGRGKQIQINLEHSNLTSGFYLLKVDNEAFNITQKVVLK